MPKRKIYEPPDEMFKKMKISKSDKRKSEFHEYPLTKKQKTIYPTYVQEFLFYTF